MVTEETTPLLRKPSPTSPISWGLYLTAAFFGFIYLIPFDMVFSSAGFFTQKYAEIGDQQIVDNYRCYFQFGGITCTVLVNLIYMLSVKTTKHTLVIVLASLTGSVLIFGFLAVSALISTWDWAYGYFVLTTTLYCLSGGFSALFKAAIFVVCGLVGPKATQGFILGQSSAGFLNSVLGLLTLAHADPVSAGCYFFLTSCVLLLSSGAVFLLFFTRNRRVRMAMAQGLIEPLQPEGEEDVINSDSEDGIRSSISSNSSTDKTPSLWYVFSQTWQFCLSIFITLVITLSCYPAPVITPTSNIPGYMYAVIMFLTFGLGDILGCMTAARIHIPKQRVLPLSLARAVFIVLIMMCNVQPRTLPVWFHSDWIPGVFYMALAWTNGVLLSTGSTYAPDCVMGAAEKTRAGTLVVFCSALGLFVGSGMFGLDSGRGALPGPEYIKNSKI
eukprot:sb/3464729/